MSLKQFYEVLEKIVPYTKPDDYDEIFNNQIDRWLINADIINKQRADEIEGQINQNKLEAEINKDLAKFIKEIAQLNMGIDFDPKVVVDQVKSNSDI